MFGIIADFIASITSILLPTYLAYKSLRTGDPATTTPWLIYFIILSLTLLAESWTLFIIGWLPFYSWFRLFFLLYLVLPQTQGAKLLYLEYFEPFIVHHENEIDHFIGDTHKQLEQMGLSYVNVIVEWVRDKILGQASPVAHGHQQPAGTGAAYASYATDLLSRFAMPNARTSAAPAVNAGAGAGTGAAFFNMLSSAANTALGAGAGAAQNTRSMPGPAAEAASIPDNFAASAMHGMTSDQKHAFIGTQRERLQAMLQGLDKEQQTLDLAYGAPSGRGNAGMGAKSRSEQSFDRIEYDDLHSNSGNGSGHHSHQSTPSGGRESRRTPSGGWMGGWLGGSPREEHDPDRRHERSRDERKSGGGPASDGWSTARDITDSIVRSSGSGRGRYDDER